MPAESIKDFDQWSETYEDSIAQRWYFDRIHTRTLDLIGTGQSPESVLDVGCGTGRFLRKIKSRWPSASLSGIDPAEGMITKARLYLPGASFVVGSAESLPFPDASFDLVISTVSFHHWADQEKAFREINRVLREGGTFALADVANSRFLSLFLRHGRMRTPGEQEHLFTRTGFKVSLQKWIMIGHILTIGLKA